jgi:hypothetical protein
MIEVCDQIAEATLTGANARELCRMLAGLINKTVVLLDARFALRASAGSNMRLALSQHWQSDDPGLGRLLRALAAERRPLRMPAVPDSVLTHGCLAIPIGIRATDLGYLLILDGAEDASGALDDTGDVALLTTSYVATLFALTLANEHSDADLGLRYEGALVDALVEGHFIDPEDALRKSTALGIADGQSYQVAIMRSTTDATQLADQAEALRARVLAVVPGAALAVRPTELVMILPSPLRSADAVPQQFRKALARVVTLPGPAGSALTCGLSDRAERPDQMPQRFRDAAHALEIGTRMGRRGQLISFNDLGIYRLLLQIGDTEQLRQFADEILGPLIHYDTTHKLGLVRTLSVFLDQPHGSLKQSATRLHVHANTVAYRLQRIEQLIPLSLADPDDRLVAHIAVKIIDVLQEKVQRP